MLFKDVIGQDFLKKKLIKSVQDNRISHALLFLGEPGAGPLPLALAYIQYLCCENRGDEDACGNCRNCLKISALQHPDLHFTYPLIKQGGKDQPLSTDFIKEWRLAFNANPYLTPFDWLQAIKAENKQGNIYACEIPEIIKNIYLKPFEAGYKIQIIWGSEYLGKEGNKLLKVIEEPPPYTIIILIAADENQLLNTIQSRTQLIKLPPLSDQEIASALIEKKGIPDEKAKRLAYISHGSFSQALQLLNNQEASSEQAFIEWFTLCYKGSAIDQVEWSVNMAGIGREHQKQFFEFALHFFHQSMLTTVDTGMPIRMHQENWSRNIFAGENIGLDGFQTVSKLLNEAIYHIERNANAKILFLNLTISMKKLLRKQRLVAKRNRQQALG